jgi:glycosyltransferase involved in cell wall biosynthesis/predicted glycosyltransferase
MRAWIDIEGGEQVPYLLRIARTFEAGGHDVLMTAGARGSTFGLLRSEGAQFEAAGIKLGDERWSAVKDSRERTSLLADFVDQSGSVDLLVSSSTSAILAARKLRIPSFTLVDDERDVRVGRLFSSFIVHPQLIRAAALRRGGVSRARMLPFDGLLQDISFGDVDIGAVPAERFPGSDPSELRVLFVQPTSASGRRLALEALRYLAVREVRVVCVASGEKDPSGVEGVSVWHESPIVLREPVPIIRLLKGVDAVVSVDGTRLREAAYLGVPAYGIARGRISAVDRHFVENDRLTLLRSASDVTQIELAKRQTFESLQLRSGVARAVTQLIVEQRASARRTTVRARQSPAADRGHICMVIHSHFPVGEPRGEREARAAVEAGYTVDVVCLGADDEPSRETVDDIRITRLPVAHVRGAPTLRFLAEYVRFAARATTAVMKLYRRERIDVVYVHAPPDFLVAAALLPKLLGSRVVLDVHDLSSHMFNIRFGGRVSVRVGERLLRAVERFACAVADRVVTVHDQYREELVAHGVDREKIAVVMNAPTMEAVEQASKAASSRSHDGSFVVAYHGTVNHWYGVDLVIEAIAKLVPEVPELSALILGEGDALGDAERIARDLGIADRVEFSRRYLPNDVALARVAAADCGVIPNRPSPLNRFALSSKLLEYVALGVPVAVARLETLSAHFNSDEVTFFDPDDAVSLADAIRWIATHPPEARAKAQRAQQRAESYSWPANKVRLLEALDFG